MPKIPSRLGGFIVKHCGDFFRSVRRLDGAPTPRPRSGGAPAPRPRGAGPDAPPRRSPAQQQWDEGLRTRPDGRTTHRNDPPGTYRDSNGRLHDDKGFTNDPNPRPSSGNKPIDHHANRGRPEPHVVRDEAWDQAVRERQNLQNHSANMRNEFNDVRASLGVDDLSASDVRKMDPADARARGISPDDFDELKHAARDEGDAAQALRQHSENMGHQATQDLMRSRNETPIPSTHRGRDSLDEMSMSTDADGRQHLNIYEAKGGDSPLGARDTPDGRAQQGSPEYLADVIQRDPDLQAFLRDNPQIADGLADGSISVNYSEVRAAPDGTVTVTPFH